MICDFCKNDIISGKYITDFWGNHYHAIHSGVVPRCFYCGRLTSSKSICSHCSSNLIDKNSQIDIEYKMILDYMNKEGFDLRAYKTEIFLIDNRESGQLKKEEPGFINFKMKKLNNTITDISFKIYIQRGLPRTYFIETLSHELMHQWLILHGQEKMKPALNEGSCNYVSYLIMNKIKTPLSYYVINRLLKDPHPFYGKGFRKVLNYSKKYGHNSLINYLKTKKNI